MPREINYTNIDEYIAQFDPEVQKIMSEVRKTIQGAAPDATEKITWDMPTFYYFGNLIHFAGAKSHLGIYPGSSGVSNFYDKLAEYKTSKGAIQFPYSKPIPYELITEIVKFRVMENAKLEEEKKAKKNNKEKKDVE